MLGIMAKHFISVCIFCFLCATHSPCESHAETNHTGSANHKSSIPFAEADAPPAFRTDQDNPEGIPYINLSNAEVLGYNLSVQKSLLNVGKNAKINNKFNRVRRNNDEVSRNKNFTNNNSVTNGDNNNHNSEDGEDYLKKIFAKYGDGKSISIEGFEKLLTQLDLMAQVLHNKVDPVLSLKNFAALISHETENMTDTNVTCLKREELLANVLAPKDASDKTQNSKIDEKTFEKLCPALLYNMISDTCTHKEVEHLHLMEPVPINENYYTIWLYSITAVVIISACGMLGLAVIPVMQKRYYQPLLQFLVALAVGTLAGDALLHLLPHSMVTKHSHDDSSGDHSDGNHDENMWKGFVAMLGIVVFFVVERIIVIVAKWRKERQLKEKVPKMKVMKEGLQPTSTSEKECKHKYSSIPYCYDAIAMIDKNHKKEGYPVFRLLGGQDNMQQHSDPETALFELESASELQPFKNSHSACNKLETNQNMTECPSELNSTNCTEVNKMLGSESEKDDTNSVEYTVILREHENKHHGHSHTHGHVHAAPKDMSSVAWMVILGDGLHNFTDGMAIGAAFSGSIAGGFSTAVAVFCHELPHELGDFAVLLKAGMTIKQALFYNFISSVLCLFGNAVGVWLGNTEYASTWVFAIAAGTFIYIALVDMMPELSSGHAEEGTLFQSFLQLSGLLVGVAVMTFIAIYEHDLRHMFHEPL